MCYVQDTLLICCMWTKYQWFTKAIENKLLCELFFSFLAKKNKRLVEFFFPFPAVVGWMDSHYYLIWLDNDKKRMPANITENTHKQVMTLPCLTGYCLSLAVLSVFPFESFCWKAANAMWALAVSALWIVLLLPTASLCLLTICQYRSHCLCIGLAGWTLQQLSCFGKWVTVWSLGQGNWCTSARWAFEFRKLGQASASESIKTSPKTI